MTDQAVRRPECAGGAHRSSSSPTGRCSHQALNHRSWCAEHPGDDEQRAAGVPRRRRARLGRRRHLVPPLRAHAGRPADRPAQERRERVGPRRRRARDRPRTAHPPRARRGRAGGAEKPSILSDAFEAVLGAVYLDGGADRLRTRMVDRLVAPGFPVDDRGPRPAGQQDAVAGVRRACRREARRCTR